MRKRLARATRGAQYRTNPPSRESKANYADPAGAKRSEESSGKF